MNESGTLYEAESFTLAGIDLKMSLEAGRCPKLIDGGTLWSNGLEEISSAILIVVKDQLSFMEARHDADYRYLIYVCNLNDVCMQFN